MPLELMPNSLVQEMQTYTGSVLYRAIMPACLSHTVVTFVVVQWLYFHELAWPHDDALNNLDLPNMKFK